MSKAVSVMSTATTPAVAAALISSESMRVAFGVATICTNSLLVTFLSWKKSMRYRYILFSLVAIADCIDAMYLVYGSSSRIVEIDTSIASNLTTNVYYYPHTYWQCLTRGYVYFRIFGTELDAFICLCMATERFIAICFPLLFHVYFSIRNRLIVIAIGICYCTAVIVAMTITSYEGSGYEAVLASDGYCGISTSVTPSFALFHQIIVITFQVLAFVISTIAFIMATYRSRTVASMNSEMQSIKPILAVNCCTVVLSTSNNVVYILLNFTSIGVSRDLQNIVVTYTPSAFSILKFAVYFLSGKEFRTAAMDLFRSSAKNKIAPTMALTNTIKNNNATSVNRAITSITPIESVPSKAIVVKSRLNTEMVAIAPSNK